MDWITQAAQLILSLSILVILHELGHFIPARLFGTRVEKFYLFFDPWFSLYKYKKNDTEYGIGWLPLGGYVKIAGMIDESMDREQMKLPAQEWEFRAKPAWQRLIIMIGGVSVNAVLGIAIYIMIAFVWGNQYIPNDQLTYGIYCDSLGKSIGLENGDRIVSIDNRRIEKFTDIRLDLVINQPGSIQIDRNGSTLNLAIPSGFTAEVIKSENVTFIEPAIIAEIYEVAAGSPAEEAGLLKGDRIVKLNQDSVPFFQDVVHFLRSHRDQEVTVGVVRSGQMFYTNSMVTEQGTLGFQVTPPGEQIQMKVETYDAFTAIPAGYKKGIDAFSNYIKQMKLIFNPETKAYESLGGFVMIAKAFSPEWDWERFWNFTAFLSIILAIMNLLPIPALDGGHVMFLLYEIVSRRKPHEKVLEYAQMAGMILLLGLLLYANGNDIVKLFK
ncbi:MAG TPA: RIP metalloprotease RseP [Flavobacteriales bacterium]|nr:RIP metalloprotease RseP [Flavobacteriales bacterium]